MASVNKVILIGNLGADPETRFLPSGESVCNLRMATTEKWKDKATGDMKEATEWHRISLFGRQAEIAGEYLKKGSSAYIEGSLRTRKWQDKEGRDQYTTEIRADRIQLLGGRGSSGAGDADFGGGSAAGSGAPRGGAGAKGGGAPKKTQPDDFDDDIPF